MSGQSPVIYFIRHGQTELNNTHVLQGRSDLPLNDTGRRQAAALGAWFAGQGIRFSRVFSSPLQRAVETARLAAGEAAIQIDERLIEMDYGPYEGMDLTDPAPELLRFFRDFVHVPAPDGMEPLPQVVGRLGDFLEQLRAGGADGNILVSMHAISMKGALEYLTPESRGSYWSKYIGNCAVYRCTMTDEGYTVPAELERPETV